MATRKAAQEAIIEDHEHETLDVSDDVVDRAVEAVSEATGEVVGSAEHVVEQIFAESETPQPTPKAAEKVEESSGGWPPPLFVRRNAGEVEAYYMKHRWQAQWLYYDAKATDNKKNYQALQLLIGVGSVAVPVLLGLQWVPSLVPVAISLLVAAAAAVENVKKYGDNWRTYRKAAEDLQREKALYDAQTGPYRRAKVSFLRFVERCEEVIAEQNGQFLQRQEETEKDRKEDEATDTSVG
jgi:hypothetical protein